MRCIHGIFGRKITMHVVTYGVYTRFWPTLLVQHHSIGGTSCIIAGAAHGVAACSAVNSWFLQDGLLTLQHVQCLYYIVPV